MALNQKLFLQTIVSITILLILFSIPAVHAQSIARSTTGVSGSSQLVISGGKSYFISQTIGQQSLVGSAFSHDHFVLQGYQQPFGFVVKEPEIKSDLEALVFPNPFQQSLDILFREKIDTEIQVIVHDVMGRLVVSKSYDASQSLKLSLEFLASGSFLLHVAVENKSFTRKIIKQ